MTNEEIKKITGKYSENGWMRMPSTLGKNPAFDEIVVKHLFWTLHNCPSQFDEEYSMCMMQTNPICMGLLPPLRNAEVLWYGPAYFGRDDSEIAEDEKYFEERNKALRSLGNE